MKKKYLVIIIVAVLLVVSSIFIGVKIFNIKDNKANNSTQVSEPTIKPANNTEELLTSSKELQNTKITKDKIEFDNSINLTNGEKIAIWLYSSPKFLGWFEVKEENGTKYIDGLDKAMEKEDIDSGSHHIAITNKDNETLGYVNVDINKDNNIEEIDAIKELGIPQDFYTLISFYESYHIHFNSDYTFSLDNEGVRLEEKGYYLKDKIKFQKGKYELIEKDNEHIMLKLTFYCEDETTFERNVAIHSVYANDEYVGKIMESHSLAQGKITLLMDHTSNIDYHPAIFDKWIKYL